MDELQSIYAGVVSDGDLRKLIANNYNPYKSVKKLESGIDIHIQVKNANGTTYIRPVDEHGNKKKGLPEPNNIIGVASYKITPTAYFNREKYNPDPEKDNLWKCFETIPLSGYSIGPGEFIILQSRERLIIGKDYCALHFGLHHNQMAGLIVANGQIEPGWGLNDDADELAKQYGFPLDIVVYNVGKTAIMINPKDPISRLVFLRLGAKSEGEGTSLRQVEEALRRSAEQYLAGISSSRKRRRF